MPELKNSKDYMHLKDRGVLVVWLASLLVVLLGISAIVVDISVQQMRVSQLKTAADSAALAAVKDLDGSLDGWRNAKRSALAALKRSRVIGFSEDFASLSYGDRVPGTAELDPFEPPNGDYAYNLAFSCSNPPCEVAVNLERGVYFYGLDGTENPSFRSYEGKPKSFSLPTPLLANAAQVSISLAGARTWFGRIFGYDRFENSTRTSAAIADTLQDSCVGPLAIPACELLLKTDSPFLENEPYTNDKYNSSWQCQRGLSFVDANWRQNLAIRDGIIRSDSYHRPPYGVGDHGISVIDEEAWPIKGVLGLPDPDHWSGSVPLDLDGLKNAMIQMLTGGGISDPRPQPCLRDQTHPLLGAKFLPLDSSQINPNFLNALYDDPALSQALALWINHSSTPTFASQLPFGANNFPYLRGYRHELERCPQGGRPSVATDLKMRIPGSETGGIQTFPSAHLLPNPALPDDLWADVWQDNPQQVWTNPLCHYPLIPRTLTASTPPRVRHIKVPLIAPADDINGDPSLDSSGNPYRYCDYGGIFGSGSPGFHYPSQESDPRIVGFVFAYLYDFNFLNLDPTGLGFPPTGDRNPMNAFPYWDDSQLVYEECAYFGQCSGGKKCWDGMPCWAQPDNTNPHLLYSPLTEPLLCDGMGICQSQQGPNPLPDPPGMPICALSRTPFAFDAGGCFSTFPDFYPGTTTGGIAQNFPWQLVRAKCFPGPKSNCPGLGCACGNFRFSNPDCWETRHRVVGRGCAGIAAKLSCAPKALSSPVEYSTTVVRRPALVAVAAAGEVQ